MDFGVRLEDAEQLVRRFRASPEVFERYMRGFLGRAVVYVDRQVKLLVTQRKAINTGAMRSSVTHEVQGAGAQMQGVVGSPLAYTPFVEEDTRPHWPPRRPIIYWVMRKFRLAGEALYPVVRGVQRKIAHRGTTGKHMFQDGLADSQGWIELKWGETWGEAVKKEL